jgi:hypothetical protein
MVTASRIEEEVTLAPPKKKARQIKPATNGEQKPVQQVVDLPEIKFAEVQIQVIGKTPLIVHCWSQKAVGMMLGKQLGEASKGRAKKDPFEDFKGSLYPVMVNGKQRYGVPSPAFKACAVTASNDVELKMTTMRRAFHVSSYTVPIDAPPIKEPITEWDKKYLKELKPYHALGISMRMDVVRLQTGVADLRFRGWFPEWSATLLVEYNPSMITLAQLLNLFRAGGWGGGICEWRPSAPECRSGEYGRFTLKAG